MKRKLTIQVKALPPRNPMAGMAKERNAGSHAKSERTLRRKAKIKMKMLRGASRFPEGYVECSRKLRGLRECLKHEQFGLSPYMRVKPGRSGSGGSARVAQRPNCPWRLVCI